MSTRTVKIVYWTTTAIVSAVMLFSVINFNLDHPMGPAGQFREGAFAHLGLPRWFKFELTAGKVLGLLALLIPGIPAKAKEFAYFGFALTLISASIAHYSSGDSLMFMIDPLIFFALLIVSYAAFIRIRRNQLGDLSRPRPL